MLCTRNFGDTVFHRFASLTRAELSDGRRLSKMGTPRCFDIYCSPVNERVSFHPNGGTRPPLDLSCSRRQHEDSLRGLPLPRVSGPFVRTSLWVEFNACGISPLLGKCASPGSSSSRFEIPGARSTTPSTRSHNLGVLLHSDANCCRRCDARTTVPFSRTPEVNFRDTIACLLLLIYVLWRRT